MPQTDGNHHKKRRSKRQSVFFNKIKKTFWLVKLRLYLHYVKKAVNNSLHKKKLFLPEMGKEKLERCSNSNSFQLCRSSGLDTNVT